MDRYEVGDLVCRIAPDGKGEVHFNDSTLPIVSERGKWLWVATLVGTFHLTWRTADGTEVEDQFEVVDGNLY